MSSKNKKTFVGYTEWKNVFNMLENEDAGKLIKHLLSFVDNDENTLQEQQNELQELHLKIAFEPMKLQLKRDLAKWNEIKTKRSEAGRQGGRGNKANKANALSYKQNEQVKAKKAVNVNVNEYVNEDVTSNKKKKKFSKVDWKKILIELGADEKIISDWFVVRDRKNRVYTETAFNRFLNSCEKSKYSVSDIVGFCAENEWLSFKDEFVENKSSKTKIDKYDIANQNENFFNGQ